LQQLNEVWLRVEAALLATTSHTMSTLTAIGAHDECATCGLTQAKEQIELISSAAAMLRVEGASPIACRALVGLLAVAACDSVPVGREPLDSRIARLAAIPNGAVVRARVLDVSNRVFRDYVEARILEVAWCGSRFDRPSESERYLDCLPRLEMLEPLYDYMRLRAPLVEEFTQGLVVHLETPLGCSWGGKTLSGPLRAIEEGRVYWLALKREPMSLPRIAAAAESSHLP
jgi:hypothetical protein